MQVSVEKETEAPDTCHSKVHLLIYEPPEDLMSFNDIPAGKDIPNDIYVAIEIPANSTPVKYEIEKEYDAVFVDRFMATPMFYPANYGYVPNTLSDDGDPLDVLVVTPYPVQPGSIVRARPIRYFRYER